MSSSPPEDPRITRSREAITAAALEHFLARGYVGANVDEIAAEARVSKRTLYNIYGGKKQLFSQLMARTAAVAESFVREAGTVLADTDEPEHELRETAVRLATTVVDARIIRLRRLLIGEAARFPELTTEYYRSAPGLTLNMLADALRRLGERGVLTIDDPVVAAEHFAFLIMGAGLDRALFTPDDQLPAPAEVEQRARAGVDVFLCAYRSRPDGRPRATE